MNALRRLALVMLASAAAGGIHADDATPDAAALAAQARPRAAEYRDYRPSLPTAEGAPAIRALADAGRRRGLAERDARLAGADPVVVRPGEGASPAGHPQTLPPGLVVLAISSSMPLQLLRDYFAQLDGRAGVVVVLRGFVDGAHTLSPTGRWLGTALLRQASCADCGHRRVPVIVDPLLFASLHIRQVPALAYLPGVQRIAHCERETYAAAQVAVGAVSVAAALRALQRAGTAVPASVIAEFGG